MLFSPSAHPVSLAPRIGDDILPTPAGEWADKTITSIKHSVDFNALVLPPSRTSTPGPRVPGAYPFEGEADYSRGIAFHEGYIRTQKNVMNAVMGAGATAKRYLPGTWGSYLSPSTERKPIILKTISQSERAKIQDDALYRSPSKCEAPNPGASSSSEDFLDHLSIEAQANSVPSQHTGDEINLSCLAPHTNLNAECDSSLLPGISTRTINGSVLSSPSRYSSQLSLHTPRIGDELLHSGSETADTTHHSSETGEPKHDLPSLNADTVTPKHPNIENDHPIGPRQPSSEDSCTAQHRVRSNTPIEGPPAFLGPIDFRSDGCTSNGKTLSIGSSSSTPKSEETRKASDTKGAVDGFHGVQQPTVNTEARTHPLAGPDAKWNGVPLEEQYQKAMDTNPDRQLNLGTRKGVVGATSNDRTGASRPRTKSVVFAKPTENEEKSQRPVSEGSIPKGITPGRVITANATPPMSGSSKASRASFIDKLKGEMKVLSGKLSNNEAKVKEGRRLMGKTA